MGNRTQLRLFISHSSKDKGFVRRLVQDLKSHNLDVWIDEQELSIGDSIVQGVSEGLRDTDYFVLVISQNSTSSKWVQQEFNAAIMSELSENGAVVLPVRIDEAPLPRLLSDRIYADFRNDYNQGLQGLLRVFAQETTILSPPSDDLQRDNAHCSCAGTLGKLSQADLRRQLDRWLDFDEVKVVWWSTFNEDLDRVNRNITKTNAIIKMIQRSNDQGLAAVLLNNVCNDYPHIVNMVGTSPEKSPSRNAALLGDTSPNSSDLRVVVLQVASAIGIVGVGIWSLQTLLVSALSLAPFASGLSRGTRFAISSAAIGFFGLIVNRTRVQRATKEGEAILSQALKELGGRIALRLHSEELLTPISVRSLARAVSLKYGCPLITDYLIIEAIRTAALDLEDRITGPELVRSLSVLNRVMLSIDHEQPALMSIAATDRLTAYRFSQPVAACLIFLIAVVVSFWPYEITFAGHSFADWVARHQQFITWVALTLEALLIVSAIRAEFFWKNRISRTRTRGSIVVNWFSPARLNPIVDFFPKAVISLERWASHFWNAAWAPIWEGFRFGLPLTRGNVDTSRFWGMHGCRLLIARRLIKELRAVQRSCDIAAMQGTSLSPALKCQFISLCRRLWIVTGDDFFREMEKTGEISGAAEALSVMRKV